MASVLKEVQGWKGQLGGRFVPLCKLLFMTLAAVLVFVYQINRPKVTHVYYTNNPNEITRNGVVYTCECNLPPSDIPSDRSSGTSSSKIYMCYPARFLETVDILMYSNFTGVERLEKILSDSFPDQFNKTRKVLSPGHHKNMQAHNVAFSTSEMFTNFTTKISKLRPNFYLGGYTQQDVEIPIDYLVSGTQDEMRLLDFPTSYVAVTFSFWCNNLSWCALNKVNDIFTQVSGGDSESDHEAWGDCIYWGNETDPNSYQGKCAMYPIATIPLNFAMDRFFQDFRAMPGIHKISPTHDQSKENYISLSPNVLYMNLSKTYTINRSVELKFFELSKGSSPWLSLLNMFPSLDTNCSSMKNTNTCDGTSMCNVFKSRQTDQYTLTCLNMDKQTQCVDIQEGYNSVSDTKSYLTIDNVEHFDYPWNELWDDFNLQNGNWTDLMCMPWNCTSAPTYSILQQTAPVMQNSSLNDFLESKLLSDSWAQNSGVCTKTYPDIIRYNESDEIMFMETNCSQYPASRYCWLTGRYHNLSDKPDDGWHNFSDEDWHKLVNNQSSSSEGIFVCSNVTDQNFVVWFLLTLGILFGWLGTIDLIFTWIKRLFQFGRRKKETSSDGNQVVDDAVAQEGVAEEDSDTKIVVDEVSPLSIDFPRRNMPSGLSLRALSDSGVRHVHLGTPRAQDGKSR